MTYISVMLAENNGMGDPSGSVNMIDFSMPNGETFLRLETYDLCGRNIWTNDRLIVMYGVRIKHSGCETWCGNMHWNCYKVPDYYAIGFINMLRRSKDWQWSEGWTSLTSKWDLNQDVTGHDIDLEENIEGIVVNPDQLELFN
jgi:hypothetical protein